MASRPVHSRSTAFRRAAAGVAALALALSLAGIAAATPGGGARSARMVFMPTLGQAHGSHGHGPGGGGTKTNNLLYNGGPVETTPSVYLIYWGSPWSTGFGTAPYDSSLAQHYVNGFFNGVGATSWDNINTQYCQNIATGATSCGTSTDKIGNLANEHVGIWVDDSTVPKRPSQSDIAAEAVKFATSDFTTTGFTYDPNATYIVLTPSGDSMQGFGTQWCAWHSATNSTSGTVAYAYLPYQPDAGASCGQNFVFATDDPTYGTGYFDGFSVVGGHEYAEALTDPNPSSGWVDSRGAETGDKCAWYYGSAKLDFGGGQYYGVQPLWSNADNNRQGGCVTTYP
jgi:hypothetical protein